MRRRAAPRSAQPSAPVTAGVVRRRCACVGTCAACATEKQARGRVQREAAGRSSASGVPAAVHDVLATPGQPLDASARAYLEPRFAYSFERVALSPDASAVPRARPAAAAGDGLTLGAPDDALERQAESVAETVAAARAAAAPARDAPAPDFSRVRVHTGPEAAASALAIGARAYTVGAHVVFGEGAYAPGTADGRRLLAHELTHTLQQDGAAPGVVQRSAGGFFSNIFQSIFRYDFSAETLAEYLEQRDRTGEIEDDWDSDNKANQIAKDWARGAPRHVLTARRKAILIREMLSGWVGPGDQEAILDLLARADTPELAYFFGEGRVSHETLLAEFGSKKKDLWRFYQRRFPSAYPEKVQHALYFGDEVPEPSPPDLAKLKEPDTQPTGVTVQRGDPLPETGRPQYDAVRAGESQKRRREPVSPQEADDLIVAAYGAYLPEDRKPKDGRGHVAASVKTRGVGPSPEGGDTFEDFLYYCYGIERQRCKRSDRDCLRRAEDICRAEETHVGGYFDRENQEIVVRTDRESPATRLHEAVHAYAHAGTDELPRYAMEGLTEYLTRRLVETYRPAKGQKRLGAGQSYPGPYQVMLELSLLVGEPLLAKVHFQGDLKALCRALGKAKYDAWAENMHSQDDWQDAIKALRSPAPAGKPAGEC
jgi:hypothetical protein